MRYKIYGRESWDFTKIDSISQNWLSTGFLCVWALEIKIQICGRPVPLKKKPGWAKKPPKTAFFGKYWPKNDQNGFKTLKRFREMFKYIVLWYLWPHICKDFQKNSIFHCFSIIFLKFFNFFCIIINFYRFSDQISNKLG